MELIIVPTAHVSKASAAKVREVILSEKPDMVAVELCRQRFTGLFSENKPSPRQLLNTPLYSLLFLLQQILGAVFNSRPGDEMREAVRAASELNIPIILADAGINTTMHKISAIPLGEKLGILLQVFTLPLAQKKKASLEDLTNPDFLTPILLSFKSSFPKTYQCLVEDRDRHMFSSLLNFMDKKIVLVVGAGHAKGISELCRTFSSETNQPIRCVVA